MASMNDEGLEVEEGDGFFCDICKMKFSIEDLGTIDHNDKPNCVNCMGKSRDNARHGI